MTKIPPISMREALHYLGWRGSPIEPEILSQLQDMMHLVQNELTPRVIVRRFALGEGHLFSNSVFEPQGDDVCRLLAGCNEAVLMAATLGAESERLLLRQQAKSSADALLLDAVLSAAIEAVCDEQEAILRKELQGESLFLTDRFSPGYGDMPLAQTREICAVLETEKTIGLTVSHSGIMMPRKSVTAVMGINKTKTRRRISSCTVCSMRNTCTLSECKSDAAVRQGGK